MWCALPYKATRCCGGVGPQGSFHVLAFCGYTVEQRFVALLELATMQHPKPADRHGADTIQYNVRVSRQVHAAFFQACRARGVAPSKMVEALLSSFVAQVQGDVHDA
jgi:hypothetical protein